MKKAAHCISVHSTPHRPNWVLDDPGVVCLALITPGIKASIKTRAVMISSQMPAVYHGWPLAERSARHSRQHIVQHLRDSGLVETLNIINS